MSFLIDKNVMIPAANFACADDILHAVEELQWSTVVLPASIHAHAIHECMSIGGYLRYPAILQACSSSSHIFSNCSGMVSNPPSHSHAVMTAPFAVPSRRFASRLCCFTVDSLLLAVWQVFLKSTCRHYRMESMTLMSCMFGRTDSACSVEQILMTPSPIACRRFALGPGLLHGGLPALLAWRPPTD